MSRRVSIKDIAKIAGVSQSTVSRVINKPHEVSEELRKKVMRVIKMFDYTPNSVARGLRKGSTKVIGVIIPDITNPFFPAIVRGIEDFLKKKGYSLILCNSDQDIEEEKKLLKLLYSKNVDGVIFTGSGEYNPNIELFMSKDIPLVFLDRIYDKKSFASYVVVDNVKGMFELMGYLVKSGYRSFALLNGNKETFSAKARYEGFLKAVKKYNIKDFEIIFGKFTYESGHRMVEKLSKIPEVLVCGNDLIAYGVIDKIEKLGLVIPNDAGVTGFDDISFSRHYKPPLTTVRQPVYELGKKAAELIFKMIESKFYKPQGIILNPEVIIRESTRTIE